ncbi:MAG: glycosyltransferase family 39 protein [Proteobacteria bacterium]|nr:glycosyltransferase family 39 protein [Pseudomonadota bacterium]
MSADTGHGLHGARVGWAFWILLAAAWFATAPWRPLFDPDEGRYAEIPREMVVSGDWVTPHLNDLRYFEKPPLQYWATAATYELFGLTPLTSRLWAFALAFACLPMVYAWVRRLYGALPALLAVAALAVSPYFVMVSHVNVLDQGLAFFLVGAVFCFTRAQLSAPGAPAERRWMLAAWAAAALAVLSKGIVVGVLAGLSLLVYSLLERDRRIWGRLHLLPGLALFLAIAAPWFVLVTLRNPSFPGFFFVHEHFARFLTTVHSRVEPWWYFLVLLAVGTLPWLMPLLRTLSSRPAADASPPGAAGAFKPLKFLLVYSLVTLGFFSASGSKLAPYILPILPTLAAVVAVRSAADPTAFMRNAARLSAALMTVAGIGLLLYSARHQGFVARAAIGWTVAALGAAALAVAVTWGRRALLPAVAVTALAAILGWQFLMNAFAVVEPTHTSLALVEAVRPQVRPGTALYSVGQYRETISPYLARTLQVVAFRGELEFGLGEEPAKDMSMEQFVRRWDGATDAVAFFDPGLWDQWRRQGLPGRVVAADPHTVIVSRL